jgi:arabinogalactan oligomer/maltooligosaccharide transport system substrate-binding protein
VKLKIKILMVGLAALLMVSFIPAIRAKSKPVEIAFSEYDDPNVYKEDFWKSYLKGFTDKNPGIVVKRIHNNDNDIRTNWQNQVLVGAGPDITLAPHDSIGLFAESGTALQLDTFFSKKFYAQFDQEMLNAYKYRGKIYGIPCRLGNCVLLIYNKALLKEPPKTMNELIRKAKSLTKGTEQYGLTYDMVEPFFIIGFLGAYGGSVFDEKGHITLNTEPMRKMVKLLYDFKYTYKIVPKEANSDVANGLFKEGKAAMTICGPWLFPQLDAAKINYGMANIPKVDNAGWPAPYSGAKVIILNPGLAKNSRRAAAVKKFVAYINSPAKQLKYAKMVSEIPTNKKALRNSYVKNDPKVKALSEQMKKAVPMPGRPEMRCIWDAMKSTLALVMGGKLKPEDAPRMMQEEALKLMKNMFGE